MVKNKLNLSISLILVGLFIVAYSSSVTLGSSVSSLIKDLGSWDKKEAKEASEKLIKKGKVAVPELINAMDNKDRRKYATRALRGIGQDASDAIPALIKAASDLDAKTREYAVEALGKMVLQADQVLPCLEKALNDKNSEVKTKATASLNFLKTYPEKVKKQKELAEQEKLKRQDDAKKQKELAEQEKLKKQNEIRKQKELAEQGDTAAQYSLGLTYYSEKKNYNEAVKWLTMAAEQGHADSQFFLGQMYYDGNGVLENEEEAVKWLTRAAEQGVKDAQANLLEIKNAKETLKVKGFYIGMSMDKAVKLLNEKYKDILSEKYKEVKQLDSNSFGWIFTDVSGTDTPFARTWGQTTIVFSSGKITSIVFSPWVVNKLFNVEDMDGKSFAQTFISNYSIPRIETEIKERILGGSYLVWAYTSDKGFKVIIAEDKTLAIEKVASAKERKFD